MAHSLWSDRPLGVQPGAPGPIAGNIDAVALGGTSPHSSVARFRY